MDKSKTRDEVLRKLLHMKNKAITSRKGHIFTIRGLIYMYELSAQAQVQNKVMHKMTQKYVKKM